MTALRAAWRRVLLPLLVLLLFFAAWKAYVVVFSVSRFILPPPERALAALIALLADPKTLLHVETTLYECLVGFGAAIVIGVVLGALLGKIDWLERALNPLVVALQVTPKIALVPLFILWFGFGPQSKIVIAASLAFFPVLTNTLAGLKSVDLGQRDVMASLNAGALASFFLLELPSALPFILTGMEVGIVLAVIGAVVGEFIGGSTGLGYLAVVSLQELKVDMLFAVILLLTLIGFVLYVAIAALRRLLIPWHESVLFSQREI